MPRIRTIKPEIASDAKLARCTRDARYTFVLLITQADDAGLIAATHRQLLGALYPHDDLVTADVLLGWIEELVEIGLVRWRATADGSPVLELVNWAKHQRIDNAGKSQIAATLVPVGDESPHDPPQPAANDLEPTPSVDDTPPRVAAIRGDSRRVAENRRLDLGPRTVDLGGGEGPRTEDHPPSGRAARAAAAGVACAASWPDAVGPVPDAPSPEPPPAGPARGGWPAAIVARWREKIGGGVTEGRAGKDLKPFVDGGTFTLAQLLAGIDAFEAEPGPRAKDWRWFVGDLHRWVRDGQTPLVDEFGVLTAYGERITRPRSVSA